MPISTTCPRCKALFRLPDDMAGKTVTCQKCQGLFLVPISDGTHVVAAVPVGGSEESPADASATDDFPSPPAEMPLTLDEEPIPAELSESIQEGTSKQRVPQPPALSNNGRENTSATKGKISSVAKWNVGLMALIAVVVSGALLSCCLGFAGIGFWVYHKEHEKKLAKNAALHPFGGTDVVIGKDDAFHSDDALRETDPVEQFDPLFGQKRFKLYVAKLEAGRSYQIDMVTNNFNFDAYLHVRDDQNNIVARDDDGGGFPNASLMLRPERTGFYRIYATSLNGFQTGNFSLIVRRF